MSSEIYSQGLHGPLDREQLKENLEDALRDLEKGVRNIKLSFEGIEVYFDDEGEEVSIVV